MVSFLPPQPRFCCVCAFVFFLTPSLDHLFVAGAGEDGDLLGYSEEDRADRALEEKILDTMQSVFQVGIHHSLPPQALPLVPENLF